MVQRLILEWDAQIMYKIKNLIRMIKAIIVGLFSSEENILNALEKKIVVFCYHDVHNEPSEFCLKYNLFVNIRNFLKQIEYIDSKFNIISVKDLSNPDFIFPKNSAIITFDDGFKGAFNNGIKYLIKKQIPSIAFLNYDSIINRKPMVSSVAKYVEEMKINYPDYDIKKNYHLLIEKKEYNKLIKNEDLNLAVKDYQGEIISIEELEAYNGGKYLNYANHYFQHFNTRIMTDEEIHTQILINQGYLEKYSSYTKSFAFTNGDFSTENLNYIQSLNIFDSIFTSFGKASPLGSKVLDRIALDNTVTNKWSMISALKNATK